MKKSQLLWPAAAFCVLILNGCAMQPVQAWEKGKLAQPAMKFDQDPMRKAFLEHVYASKEGASGGSGVAGGGCGCN